MKKVGVLDIQGSVIEHVKSLRGLGAEVVQVKTADDLQQISGLIIPGGESTTIGKLLQRFGLDKAIKNRAAEGMAVWGTCAGAILLAKKIVGAGAEKVSSLALMDIEIERNAYGRQLDSFETDITFEIDSKPEQIPAVFIRAPQILKIGPKVKVLAKHGTEIIAAREDNFLATSFHPELTTSQVVHKYFLELCN